MKITKYPHSCIMVESKGKKVLFDPGNINFKDEYINEWKKADYVFVTHRHSDHCYADIIKDLGVTIYATKEVNEKYPEMNVSIIKSGNIIRLEEINVEVVDAVHGYLPDMKGNKIKENVGYILDDKDKRIYISSDTICFENDYKADILCLAVSGHVSMTEYEASLVAKDMNAELVIPIHMESPKHPVDVEKVRRTFEQFGVNYKIMQNGESIEF